jgi:hypothetical protein
MMDESDLHDHRPPIIGFILLLLLLPHSTVTEVTLAYRTHALSLSVSSPESWWVAALMMVWSEAHIWRISWRCHSGHYNGSYCRLKPGQNSHPFISWIQPGGFDSRPWNLLSTAQENLGWWSCSCRDAKWRTRRRQTLHTQCVFQTPDDDLGVVGTSTFVMFSRS